MLLKSSKILFLVIFLTFSIILQNCGGSSPGVDGNAQTQSEENQQQEKMSDIEQLLGIEGSESQSKTKPNEKNDDILTLLGAGEKPKEVDANKSSSQNQTRDNSSNIVEDKPAAMPVTTTQKADPNMEKQLRDKDAEIQRLRNELMNKEATIQRLENAPPPTASGKVIESTIPDYEYENIYQQGLAQFNDRNYKEAISVFERLLGSNDNHSLSDNAQYWIGESHYMMGNYKEAILDFEKVFSYPNANKKDHAQFKLGKCYERIGDKNRAREEYQRFLSLYPKSDLRSKAEKALQNI